MKKLIYNISIIAGALFIASACSKNLPEDNNLSGLTKVTFEAGTEELASVTQAKAHFNDWQSYQLYWDAEDKISVFSNGTNYQFSNTEADGTRASFEGQVSVSGSYVALYPYNDKALLASNKVSTTMPAAQTAVEHGTDKSAMIAVAQSSGNSLAFKNVYGILKFKIVDEDITSVTLEGNNNEVIAGDIDITVGDKPSYVVTGNASTEIVLNPVGEFFTPGDYAIALLPVDFQAGFKLIFTHDGTAKAAIRATKSELFSVKRNGGLDALNMEFEAADYKYYYIRTKEDLDAWHADYAKWATSDKVYLANDIDYKGGVWVAQNAAGTEFKGLFDGRGHSILNIHMESPNNHAGFLRRVTGTVKNLTIGSETDNSCMIATISSGDASLGIVALLDQNGKVENVINYADVSPSSGIAYCGAVVGKVRNGVVQNCKNYGNVLCSSIPNLIKEPDKDDGFNVGGIVGLLEKGYENSLSNCENHGALTFTVSGSEKNLNLGGIVGQITSEAEVSESDNYGSISITGNNNKKLHIGGIVGINQNNVATISNCNNSNAITNSSSAEEIHIGGILGSSAIATSVSNCNNTTAGVITDNGTCTYEYSSNTTVGAAGTAGIVGASTAATTITDCTNSGSVSNNSASVYMAVSGILGYNTTAVATLTRCKNLGKVTSKPAATSANQIIRIAGMVAISSIAGTVMDSCENYGDLTLDNTNTIFRNWIGGAIGYCKYPDVRNGKYYATITRGTVTSGKVAAITGQADTRGGYCVNNGIGGVVAGTTITAANFNNYRHGQAVGYTETKDNYFLAEKPNVGTVATPALSYNNDNQPW